MRNVNTAVFESLFKEYHPMVLQVCKGFAGGDIPIAEDLAQEVFVNVLNALGKFEGRSSHKTWIYRITVNTCLQHKRKEKRIPHFVENYENEIAGEEKNDPEITVKPLYQAIDQLGKVDRLIIMMVLEELEYDEIATVIGITESTLRVKIHRIKKRLKKIMTHGQGNRTT